MAPTQPSRTSSLSSSKADAIVISADTLLITIPTRMGDVDVKILYNFATHAAPALGWQPNREGPVIGYPID